MFSRTFSIPSTTASSIRWHNSTYLLIYMHPHTHTRSYLSTECRRLTRCKKPYLLHLSNQMLLNVLWNGVLLCVSTCGIPWWRHCLDVFYLYFPWCDTREIAEELETLALGPWTGFHPTWIHPCWDCCASIPTERSRIFDPGCTYKCCSISQGKSCDCDFSTCICLCRFLKDSQVYFLPNWKAIIPETYLKRWKESIWIFLPILWPGICLA